MKKFRRAKSDTDGLTAEEMYHLSAEYDGLLEDDPALRRRVIAEAIRQRGAPKKAKVRRSVKHKSARSATGGVNPAHIKPKFRHLYR